MKNILYRKICYKLQEQKCSIILRKMMDTECKKTTKKEKQDDKQHFQKHNKSKTSPSKNLKRAHVIWIGWKALAVSPMRQLSTKV